MGIFDASQPPPEYDEDDENAKIPLPKVAAFELHTRTISSIKAPMYDHNSVFTSSYDSSIRCLDLPTQVSSQLWQPDDDGTDLGISCIDVSAESKDVILFSTLDGSVGRIDRRAKGKTDVWGLTDNKIGGFSSHPLLPHLLATASLDRTLKIWDLRKFTHNISRPQSPANWQCRHDQGQGRRCTPSITRRTHLETIRLPRLLEPRWQAGDLFVRRHSQDL